MRKGRRKRRAWARVPLHAPVRINQAWSMDYTHDQLASGRRFRTLNIVNGLSRESLAIEVNAGLPPARVVRVLERIAAERGYPEWIVTDDGPEFTGRALEQWTYQLVNVAFAGKPNQPDRVGETVSGLARQYGSLGAAASALGYPNAKALLEGILSYCGSVRRGPDGLFPRSGSR